ncbi:sorting nexin-4-like isoform X2 [Hydractinia symbiolongicarpus]|uniref:sorting nexin-4-like isoform X2 n=1 Tax=Hydractinia symbiolongicarpus TaxID=13093 RepID=UPI00254A8563|nr:sorting nexin-4-like isoform X2 [Hydractinia symbiolongicarpus]
MANYRKGDHSDGKKLYFPEGALLNQMEVAVVESERRKSEILKEPFVVYLVESRPLENTIGIEQGCALWRRYSEFELLRNYLMAIYPFIVMPPLPEKRINVAKFQLAADKFDPDFIERRRQGLECFLLRLASHPVVSQDPIFRGFLNQEDSWKESVASTQWQQKADSRFKSISASMSIKKPDERFDNIRSYSESLNTNISSLLKVQQRISHRQQLILKQHTEYGKLFSEWSAIEDELGDILQQAGHQMDTLSSQTETVLNEEEVAYIDQLKEYLYFTESLKAIVRKQHLRHYDLEKAEEALSIKSKQKDELAKEITALENGEEVPQSGFTLKSVSNMLFGQDSLEAKQEKMLTLEEQVRDAEQTMKMAENDVNVFVEKSLKDFDRFKKQKVRDVNEIMENYVKTQIKANRNGIQQWQAMKEYFMSM